GLVPSLGRQPSAYRDQPAFLSHPRGRHALRSSRLSQRRLFQAAPKRDRNGVRERDGDQSVPPGNEDRRSPSRPEPRRTIEAAAPAHLAGRLAPPALPAPFQFTLALPLPGLDPVLRRISPVSGSPRCTVGCCVT